MSASLTARGLNRATLDRQLLLRREELGAVEAVRRVTALQAQEPASPYLALWNRLANFDPADLDAAFADRSVVKASLMRITLHAVCAEDYPDFHNAMVSSLRGSRLYDARFTGTGLTAADADALAPHLAEFAASPRSGVEIQEFFGTKDLDGERQQRAWWALKTFAALHHAPTGGAWSFKTRATFLAAESRLDPESVDQSVQWLLRRYLQAFGPATAQDFAQFTLLRRPVARQALTALGDELVELEGPDGTALFDIAGAALPDEDVPAPPRLLPMWESTLLAYSDRRRIIPPDYRPLIIKRNGDVLPALLVDGYVAGVWRCVEGGIEVTAFPALDKKTWKELDAEAAALVAFLADRDPTVYSRFNHWWVKGLPGTEVRVIPS